MTLRDETDLASKHIYIGHVAYTDKSFARIIPYARAFEDGWELVATPTNIEFPDVGRVFSLEPEAVGHEGRVLLFTLRLSESYTAGKDKYITDQVGEPYEVRREFQNLDTNTQRAQMVTGGIDRDGQAEGEVIVPLNESDCVVLSLVKAPSTGLWHLDVEQDLAHISTWASGDCLETLISVEGRCFALPGSRPKVKIGQTNWQNDADFLEAILRLIKKNDDVVGTGGIANLTRSAIERVKRAFNKAELLSEHPAENSAALNRLSAFLEHAPKELAAAERIAEVLAADPAIVQNVADEVRQLKSQLIEKLETELRPAVEAKIDTDFAILTSDLEAMAADLRRLMEERDGLQSDIDKLRSTHRDEASRLEASFQDLLAKLTTAGNDVKTLVEFGRSLGVDLGGASPPHVPQTAPPWQDRGGRGDLAFPLERLSETLKKNAKGAGLPINVVTTFDIAVRAGRVAVVGGDGAAALIDLYSNAVCGGRLHQVILDATVLGPDDVWDRRSPSQTSLRSAWSAALAAPETLHLVCLLGLERANLADWLADFAELFAASRPCNLLVAARCAEGSDELNKARHLGGCIAIDIDGSSVAEIKSTLSPRPGTTSLTSPFIVTTPADHLPEIISALATIPELSTQRGADAAALFGPALSWASDHAQIVRMISAGLGISEESESTST